MTNTYTTNNSSNTITLNSGALSGTISSGATVGGITSIPMSSGTSGQYFTTGTSNSYTWATPTTSFNDGTNPVMTIPVGTKTLEIDKAATLDVKGTVKINGIDLEERLKTIEKVLMIPERDVNMEAKYPSLKKKYDEYIAALGKYRTFEAIKGKDE